MSNKNYLKGVRLERQIVNHARKCGFIAFRSAGSHSPIDCTIIDPKTKRVRFIQAKNLKRSHKPLNAKFKGFSTLSDTYFCTFEFAGRRG